MEFVYAIKSGHCAGSFDHFEEVIAVSLTLEGAIAHRDKLIDEHPHEFKSGGYNSGYSGNGKYYIESTSSSDFFDIEEVKLDLEIDGKQHKRRKESDERRDLALSKHGYNVYRIKWKSINNKAGQQYIKKEIDRLIEYIKLQQSLV